MSSFFSASNAYRPLLLFEGAPTDLSAGNDFFDLIFFFASVFCNRGQELANLQHQGLNLQQFTFYIVCFIVITFSF